MERGQETVRNKKSAVLCSSSYEIGVRKLEAYLFSGWHKAVILSLHRNMRWSWLIEAYCSGTQGPHNRWWANNKCCGWVAYALVLIGLRAIISAIESIQATLLQYRQRTNDIQLLSHGLKGFALLVSSKICIVIACSIPQAMGYLGTLKFLA